MQHHLALQNGQTRRFGFALVVALSFMAYILLLLLSITTIVRVESESAAIQQDQLEAVQSALLALNMAIGQLQAYTGLDTRVTASSQLLDENSVHMTGAWRSWEGSDREANGKPTAPNYGAKRDAGDLDASNPFAGLDVAPDAGRFLGWLTSAELPDDPDDPIPDTILSNTEGDGLVPLVGSGSVAQASEKVYIAPTLIDKADGASTSMAWWVSGDNAKAMINADLNDAPTTVQDWQERVRSNGRADPESFELEAIDDSNDANFGKLIPSTETLSFVAAPSAELRRFHDLTVFNRGLLTNTAVGGWRRDLSLMTESYDAATSSTSSSLPSSGLPFYTLRPGSVFNARKAVASNYDPGALLYPWLDSYRRKGGQGWQRSPAIGSWTLLADYCMQYKKLEDFSVASTEFPQLGSHCWPSWNDPGLGWTDKIRVAPIISRVHWIFSLAAEVESNPTDPNNPKYYPKVLVTPVVTIWNPYNVEIEVPSSLDYRLAFQLDAFTPFRFKFWMGGEPAYSGSEGLSFGEMTTYSTMNLTFPSENIILAPGANRVYSVSGVASGDGSLPLEEGYALFGGFEYYIEKVTGSFSVDAANKILLDAGDEFAVEAVTADAELSNGQGRGVHLDVKVGQGGNLILVCPIRDFYNVNDFGGVSAFDDFYPALEPGDGSAYLKSVPIEDLVNERDSEPFAASMLASRISSPLAQPSESNFTHLLSKGFIQASPLGSYQEMRNESASDGGTPGVLHPINSGAYAFSYRDVLGWNDTGFGWIPQVDGDNSSYIVAGLEPNTGLTRCIMAELPTRPIQSLCDLQHWDARNNNPVPPFQFNIVGNASATPLLPKDKVSVLGTKTANRNMVNDDSYLLNHVLFDDWFVSSIAPDYGNFGTAPQRELRVVYEQHLSQEESLPNRFYLPSADADLPNASNAASAMTSGQKDSQTDKYPFETVASKLEVSGMFNINSTSVDAWRAILKHSRDVEVPYLDANGRIEMDDARSFTYPRTSIAGDQGTDSGSSESGLSFSSAAEFVGHRVLTEEQIDRLAEYIVDEIRERGPFLSLSEFINRRLTTDVDLALAGAVQHALDNLAALGASASENPYRELQANSVEITDLPPGNHQYSFPEAALGSSAFGLPGWIRQADILRPLAPLLSARDDTFTIRTYGDVRDPINPDKVIAQAWCEAVVVRAAEFVDPVDDSIALPHSTEMISDVNRFFGRKYKVVSLRWLSEEEI